MYPVVSQWQIELSKTNIITANRPNSFAAIGRNKGFTFSVGHKNRKSPNNCLNSKVGAVDRDFGIGLLAIACIRFIISLMHLLDSVNSMENWWRRSLTGGQSPRCAESEWSVLQCNRKSDGIYIALIRTWHRRATVRRCRVMPNVCECVCLRTVCACVLLIELLPTMNKMCTRVRHAHAVSQTHI